MAVTTVRRVVKVEVEVEVRLLERLMLDCPVVQETCLVFVPCWPIVCNRRQNTKPTMRRVQKERLEGDGRDLYRRISKVVVEDT